MLRSMMDELYTINKEMNRLFGDYDYDRNKYGWAKTNIYENTDGYIIISRLPGLSKDEVEITLKDNTLKISGNKTKETSKDTAVLLNERYTGNFERNFILNDRVDTGNIQAEMQNGLLMIKIPKSPESKPKKIEIN